MVLQLSPKFRRNLSRTIPFGIIWLVSGWVFLIVEQAAAGNSAQDQSSRVAMNLEVFLFSSAALMAEDAIAPKYGSHRLSHFFQNEMDTIKKGTNG